MKKALPRCGRDQNRVFVKRYAGQRLYRPAIGTYLTRGDLMSEKRRSFVAIDAGREMTSPCCITHSL
jgi:polyhydroxyalkanoate synthesis regulator protein